MKLEATCASGNGASRATADGLCALAVMTKAPRAGQVKTRLTPPLTPEEAAALNACFLRDTTMNIADLARQGDAAGVAVYTPANAVSAFDGLLPEGFGLLAQRGEDFGARLWHAAEDLLSAGYAAVCLIDSDSPTLAPQLLEEAVAALHLPGERVVLGAAQDGGYYLIGLKRAQRHLFENIAWSTAQVLAQTMQRAAEIELEVELLPTWYDVDEAVSLAQLCDELLAPARNGNGRLRGYEAPHTRAYLQRLIAAEGRARIWPARLARQEAR